MEQGCVTVLLWLESERSNLGILGGGKTGGKTLAESHERRTRENSYLTALLSW